MTPSPPEWPPSSPPLTSFPPRPSDESEGSEAKEGRAGPSAPARKYKAIEGYRGLTEGYRRGEEGGHVHSKYCLRNREPTSNARTISTNTVSRECLIIDCANIASSPVFLVKVCELTKGTIESATTGMPNRKHAKITTALEGHDRLRQTGFKSFERVLPTELHEPDKTPENS